MSLAVVLLVAVAGLWGGEASWIQVSSPRPVPAQVDIFVNLTTEGFVFNPATIAAPPNATVHVRITQRDPVPHTFTVGMEKDRDLPRSWTPQQLDDYLRDNNLTDVFIPDVVDTVVWANFTAPAEVGRYEYVCLIAGHFQGGMSGFMVVREEGLGDDGAGARIDLIQGIMIATVVFVLLFAAGYHVRAVRAHRRSR